MQRVDLTNVFIDVPIEHGRTSFIGVETIVMIEPSELVSNKKGNVERKTVTNLYLSGMEDTPILIFEEATSFYTRLKQLIEEKQKV